MLEVGVEIGIVPEVPEVPEVPGLPELPGLPEVPGTALVVAAGVPGTGAVGGGCSSCSGTERGAGCCFGPRTGNASVPRRSRRLKEG